MYTVIYISILKPLLYYIIKRTSLFQLTIWTYCLLFYPTVQPLLQSGPPPPTWSIQIIKCSYTNDSSAALLTMRSKVYGVIPLTVQKSSLLHKANVQQLGPTLRVGTDEVVRAPTFAQSSNKRTPRSRSKYF